MHKQLHGGFNHKSSSNDVGLVVIVEIVKEMTGVIFWGVDSLLCSEKSAIGNSVFTGWLVGFAVYADTMRDFHLQ